MKRYRLKHCIFCNKQFKPDQTKFELHMGVHTQERPYNCKICAKSFKDLYNLKFHKNAVHGGPNKNVRFGTKCEVCDKPMRCWSQLTVHMRTHTGEKPYKCDKCPVKFATVGALKRHAICVHSGIKPYKCDSCSKTFATQGCLKLHFDKYHTKGKKWKGKCQICDKTFFSKQGLKRHIKLHFDRSKPFECGFCDKKFRTNSELNKHTFVHTNENRRNCLFCGKQFTNLEFHLRTHTQEKPFHCSSCYSSFAAASILKAHLSTHSKEKKFQCDICKKRFSLRRYLKLHSSVHSNERRYKCNLCHKRFSTLRTLTMHTWTHTGEKPYKCKDCRKDFRSNALLKTHRLRHHFLIASKEFHIFTCVFCQTVYADKNSYFYHILGHIQEKAYSCKFCEFGCSRKSYIREHVRRVHQAG